MAMPPRILIAEDDAIQRAMWVDMLRHFRPDIHIIEAVDGHSAYRLYQQVGADIIITDNQMPGMTGTDLVHTLRATRAITPIVLVSSGDVTHRDVAFDARTMILAKPVRIRQLLDTITHLLAG